MADIYTFSGINELHEATDTLQRAVLADFNIYRNEDADKTCRQSMDVHRCNFFQVAIDRQSSYSLYREADRLDTSANTIYFVGAGKLTSWQTEPGKRTWQGYSIIFKPEFLSIGNNNCNCRKEFPFLRADDTACLSIDPQEKAIFELCERMLHEQSNRPPDPNILRHYLFTFLYTLRRMYKVQHAINAKLPSREAEIAGRFEELLYEGDFTGRSIHSYAAQLFVSPQYLAEATRNVYGMTAKRMIMGKVLDDAKALLIQTNLTLTEIALKLNFTDTSNFIKFFKKLSGEGPSDFRSRVKILP